MFRVLSGGSEVITTQTYKDGKLVSITRRDGDVETTESFEEKKQGAGQPVKAKGPEEEAHED
jgi:hypothetical protein